MQSRHSPQAVQSDQMIEKMTMPDNISSDRAFDFDPSSLENILRAKIPNLAGEMALEKISGGQSNPTFFVTFANRRLVMRKQPSGNTLPTAHAVDREYRIISALSGGKVPVPTTVFIEEDPSILGGKFYLMDRLDGRVMHESHLPAMTIDDRKAAYSSVAEVLASLHRVDWKAAGLEGYGRESGYFARQLARWTKQWHLSKTREIPEIDELAKWLEENLPTDEVTTIVHGDYRVGNLMFHESHSRIVGVLDWELSTLGHPYADLAHCEAMWFITPEEYGGLLGLDLKANGLPSREEFEEIYFRAFDRTDSLKPFHLVFALFRFAIIFEGIAARAKSGSASSGNAAKVGLLSDVLARRAAEFLSHGVTGSERMHRVKML